MPKAEQPNQTALLNDPVDEIHNNNNNDNHNLRNTMLIVENNDIQVQRRFNQNHIHLCLGILFIVLLIITIKIYTSDYLKDDIKDGSF
jgi:hypothetical protein